MDRFSSFFLILFCFISVVLWSFQQHFPKMVIIIDSIWKIKINPGSAKNVLYNKLWTHDYKRPKVSVYKFPRSFGWKMIRFDTSKLYCTYHVYDLMDLPLTLQVWLPTWNMRCWSVYLGHPATKVFVTDVSAGTNHVYCIYCTVHMYIYIYIHIIIYVFIHCLFPFISRCSFIHRSQLKLDSGRKIVESSWATSLSQIHLPWPQAFWDDAASLASQSLQRNVFQRVQISQIC